MQDQVYDETDNCYFLKLVKQYKASKAINYPYLIDNYPKQSSKHINLDEKGKQIIHPFKLTKEDSLSIAKFIAYDLARDKNIEFIEENDEEEFAFGYLSDQDENIKDEEFNEKILNSIKNKFSYIFGEQIQNIIDKAVENH